MSKLVNNYKFTITTTNVPFHTTPIPPNSTNNLYNDTKNTFMSSRPLQRTQAHVKLKCQPTFPTTLSQQE